MRWQLAIIVVACGTVAPGLSGCNGCRDGIEESEPAAPVLQTDLARLRKVVKLPPGDFPCRWMSAPRTKPGGFELGPSDYTISAAIDLDEATWKVLLAGAPDKRSTVTWTPDRVAMYLPSQVGIGKPKGDRIEIPVRVVPHEGFQNSVYVPQFAYRIGNTLYVSLSTM